MENYRKFINPAYSVRQVLVEHQHFNEPDKRNFIKQLLLDSVKQNAIPIINYNDSVSNDETRKMELYNLRQQQEKVVECIDNDETASEIASLVKSKYLLILTSSIGLLEDPQDNNSLIKEVSGKDIYELLDNINELKKCCIGASRKGANGMKAKLDYLSEPIKNGTTVIIGHSKYRIQDLLSGNVERTIFKVR
jgi:glutamate 5-kinase